MVSILSKVTQLAGRIVRRLSDVGIGTLVVLVLITVVDVGGRVVFNRPLRGAVELTEVLMVAVVALSLAFCGFERRHIDIDIVFNRLPRKGRFATEVFAQIVSLSFVCLLGWQGILGGMYMQRAGGASQLLSIPFFPFYFLIAFGFILLALVYLLQLVDTLLGRGK